MENTVASVTNKVYVLVRYGGYLEIEEVEIVGVFRTNEAAIAGMKTFISNGEADCKCYYEEDFNIREMELQ